MRSRSATEVPPNFITNRDTARPLVKQTGGSSQVEAPEQRLARASALTSVREWFSTAP